MTINIKKRRRERERALRAVFQLDYHRDEAELRQAVMAVAMGDAGFDEGAEALSSGEGVQQTPSEGASPEAEGLSELSEDAKSPEEAAPKEDTRYAELICETVIEHREAIDERISRYIRKDWAFDRIPEAEKAVLRVAAAEMIYLDMPKEIAINEAVELAKHYGGDNATGYINGILHRMSVDNLAEKKAETKTDDTPSQAKDNPREPGEPKDEEIPDGKTSVEEDAPEDAGGWRLKHDGQTDDEQSDDTSNR